MFYDMTAIRCCIMRGGSSKGVFFKACDLPNDPHLRDAVILAAFGSPDIRQIDGLGGADVLTSKVAIIAPPSRPDADVDYTFGQVSMTERFIDYKGNCGNISSAVGAFAIDEGLVAAHEPVTTVRIHQTNSHTLLVAQVPVRDGKALQCGDFQIDGVPGAGAKVSIDWADTSGSVCGCLLPTGNVQDIITVNSYAYPVSLIDMGNPLVFIRARSLGMIGTESPAEIEGNPVLMDRIEKIRSIAAVKFGLVNDAARATLDSPYNPFFAIVSPPATYQTLSGCVVKEEDVDIVARLVFMHHMHKAYPITGAVCTGAASTIRGSIVWEAMRATANGSNCLRIGHPCGCLPVEVESIEKDGASRISKLRVFRTARRIMDGQVYIHNELFSTENSHI